jgi:hypothetical protein
MFSLRYFYGALRGGNARFLVVLVGASTRFGFGAKSLSVPIRRLLFDFCTYTMDFLSCVIGFPFSIFFNELIDLLAFAYY